jgi:hypothetical protein
LEDLLVVDSFVMEICAMNRREMNGRMMAERKASSYYFKSDENSSVGNGDFH